MGGHVISALQGMGVDRVILRYQSIEPVLQVDPGAVVIVFLDQQAGGSVLDKKVAHAVGDRGAADSVAHRRRDVVETLARDGNVENVGHGGIVPQWPAGFADGIRQRNSRTGRSQSPIS